MPLFGDDKHTEGETEETEEIEEIEETEETCLGTYK